ncbi:GNAT family N-acetyltransferase [Bacillus sp. 31A1R]|uniref:GNAT family N-acetyltransferase n=1 Tax=Robertmurraya mangrovi TaxID=3098077 RepID=A0ABU5J4C2_9BACI|nr:GNAT family N-acetyltransferase [Bacillus sp. 31A1R]MDZ5474221.1 GNAT family N-acetyltransferase [Bacillus sp. 31A1R]
MDYQIVTLKEQPELEKELGRLHEIGWPTFMRMDPVADLYWDRMLTNYPELQFFLLEGDRILACGHAIGFEWDGEIANLPEGWDGVIEKGVLDKEANKNINAVSAISIVIDPAHQGKGLSEIMVRAMKGLAKNAGLTQMVAPVRPSMKPKYPLLPIESYAYLIREDGQPFDPWIRVHCKTGAEIVAIAHQSMIVEAEIADWEKWTGMKLPLTGEYVIPGALVPLVVNIEENKAVYVEPNVWLRHHL